MIRRKLFVLLAALLEIMGTVNAQYRKEGVIVESESGKPLSGATVLVKGGEAQTKSDIHGRFSLQVDSEMVALQVRYLGYRQKEVLVSDSDVVIELERSRASLDEVVVVGYGTQRKRNVTSSISSVSGSEIEDYPVLEVGQALQGKVAGAQIIQNSGSPGASLLVRIRGAGTVNNGAPLYVVDGNLGVDPIDIDPNNIESIEVLKSASAAAIYGAQGANGVVMITTKKGSVGSVETQFNYYTGFQQVHRTLPVANATEYATLYNQALVNAGRDPLFENVEQLGDGTDWQGEIFNSAPVHNVDFSVSGGSEQGRFYFSAGYFDQKGIVGKSDYNRYSVMVNSEYNVAKGVSVGQNLSISYGIRNAIPEFGTRNPIPNAWSMDPSTPVKNADGSWGFPKFSDTNNPVAELELHHNTHKRPALNGSMFVDIDIMEGLVFRSQFNMNLGATSIYGFTPTYDIFPLQRNLVSDINRRENKWMDWDWQNTVTFQRAFRSHNLEILGGVTAMDSHTEFISSYGQGLPENANINSNLRYLDLAREGNLAGGSAGEYGMLSFLGRVNYNYKGKYLFTGNFRVDGSSKFGKNNRFGTFPSFSVGWRISDENFMKDVHFIDDLKIRGGWGMLGNQNSLTNYAFANTVSPNLVYPFGGTVQQGQAAISLGNDQLQWEATNETEVGLDFVGFNNRVNLSLGYYDKKTENMLVRLPTPTFLGIQTPPFVNGGDVRNRGFEFLLGYQESLSERLSYDVSINFSKNRNEVTQLSERQATIFSGSYSRTTVGEPIGSFFGYVMDGLFQSEEEVEAHAFQASGTAPGDIRFKDLNGDGRINQDDRATIGNPWPTFVYGLNGSLRWRQFDLNIALQGVYGNDIVGAWKYFTRGSNFYNYEKEMFNAWNGPGTSSSVPRLTVNDPNNNMRASSYFVEDGSYLRVKNVQIGYTFSNIMSKNISRLRLYLSGQNLLTFTQYNGYDPEIGAPSTTLSLGVDNGFYPQPRIITAGIGLVL